MPTGYVPRNQLSGIASGDAGPSVPIPEWAAPYITPEQWTQLVAQARAASQSNTPPGAGMSSPGIARSWGQTTPEQRFTSILNATAARSLPQGAESPFQNDSIARAGFVGAGVGSILANVGAGAVAGGAGGGGATTYPLAASGPVTVSPLAGGAGGAATAAGGSMALSGLDWANIGTSILGLLGSKEAGDDQADAAAGAAAGLERADLRAREDLQLFRDAGGAALNPLIDFVSKGPESELERTEGFTQIQNSAAANGKLRSGGTLKALTEFNSMLNSRNRNSRFNELFNLATLGSNAAARQSTNTLNTASQVGDLTTGGANAKAAGLVGGINQLNNGLENFVFLRALGA